MNNVKSYFQCLMTVIILSLLMVSCKEPEISKVNDGMLDGKLKAAIIDGVIYHIDMEDKSLYDLFMIESLQGNVNRISPLIWVLKTPLIEYDGPGNMVDRSFWLNTITDRPKVQYTDAFTMVKDFSSKINGCIIYDDILFGNYISGARYPQPSDDLVAKLNVTAMLCAKYNAIALTDQQRLTLKNSYGVDLPILASTSTIDFSNWQACYSYMYNNFNSDFNTQMMANSSHYCLSMFDFLIKNKMFIINIKGSPSAAEQILTDNIFNRSSGSIPVYGIWNLTGVQPNEDMFQQYINNQGKYSIPCNEAFNLSFTSGLPKYIPMKSETNRHLIYDPTKKYICFTETDGDNYEFIQQVYPKKYEVSGRGSYPIGWEIASTLCTLDPIAAKYFYSNIEQNCFVNSVSGAGYNKFPLPQQYQSQYFALTDLNMIDSKYRTIRTINYSFDEGRPLTSIPSVEGVFCGYGGNDATRPTIGQYPQTHQIYNGKPIFINYSFLDVNSVKSYNGTTPAFFSIACVYVNPSDVINTINSLSADWVVVSPNELIDLYKQYGGGILSSGQYITQSQYITSSGSTCFLTLQNDGNLVQFKGSGPSNNLGMLWNSGTTGTLGNYFAMLQSDGNFCIYKGTGPSDNQGFVWSTGVTGSPDNYFLSVQDDYNLCIYHGTGSANNQGLLWAK